MAIDLKKMRAKLEAMQSKGKGSSNWWKPSDGEQSVRIVPTPDGDPFKEHWFHYNVGNSAGFMCPKKNFNEDYELTSLIGNVSTKDNKPFLHIHVNISNQKCQAFGGHLFSGDIIATGEIKIFITDTEINRSYNDETGLYLWDFEHCES